MDVEINQLLEDIKQRKYQSALFDRMFRELPPANKTSWYWAGKAINKSERSKAFITILPRIDETFVQMVGYDAQEIN